MDRFTGVQKRASRRMATSNPNTAMGFNSGITGRRSGCPQRTPARSGLADLCAGRGQAVTFCPDGVGGFSTGRGLVWRGAGTGLVALEGFFERVPPLLPEAWNAVVISIGCHSFPRISCCVFVARQATGRLLRFPRRSRTGSKAGIRPQAGSQEN